jgi:hypothetical protein
LVRLDLQIALEPFAVELEEGPLADALATAWSAFLGPSRDDARTLRFTADGRAEPSGQRQMPIIAGTQITGDGFEAHLLGRHAEVTGAHQRFGIESVLKLMLATALLPRSALLIHSVALSDGTSCAVLLGESGAGKSTLGAVGAFAGLRRLGDELVVLEASGRAHGTPWNTGVPESAKLVLFGTLGWGDGCRLEPVSASDFLPLLLSNTLLPDEMPTRRTAVFQVASRLLIAHPPERFFFPPNASAADFLRTQLLSRATRPPPPKAG